MYDKMMEENNKLPRRVLIVASTLHIGGAEYVIANLCHNVP